MDFAAFPKIARLNRNIVVTEKIDGTNAQIVITKPLPDGLTGGDPVATASRDTENGPQFMFAGSRSRWITPNAEGVARDNFGFAAWVAAHQEELWALGAGTHFGEWWGYGIQRGYGLTEKRFSLFNTSRWREGAPACCHVVPVLGLRTFDSMYIEDVMVRLKEEGSVAAPGFMQPEGIVVFHTASSTMYKYTLDGDAK